jgi:hypothetical protein
LDGFRIFGKVLKYQNSIKEHNKSRLKLRNACYHSVQNLAFLSKNTKMKKHSSTNVLVVLYGCEIQSFILREERSLRMFVNSGLRRIFEPKKHEVTGKWRKLRSKELSELYIPLNIFWVIKSRGMNWTGHVECTGERISAYMVLAGKTEGNNHWRTRT